jgi:hypothetical protein
VQIRQHNDLDNAQHPYEALKIAMPYIQDFLQPFGAWEIMTARLLDRSSISSVLHMWVHICVQLSRDFSVTSQPDIAITIKNYVHSHSKHGRRIRIPMINFNNL